MPGANAPYSRLDADQIIQNVYDETQDKLRVDSSVSVTSITGEVAVEIDAADGDNVAISDGTNTLTVNPDGSINVSVTTGPTVPTATLNTFAEISSIAPSIETSIVAYTVPFGKTAQLLRTQFSGTNIATYNLYKNGSKIAVSRTYFSGSLTADITFVINDTLSGLELIAGDIITLKVIHNRPNMGDFDGRIQVLELG